MHMLIKQQAEEEANKFHFINGSCVRTQNIHSYEGVKVNLPSENKWMHKFTKVAIREKNDVHVTDYTFFDSILNIMKLIYSQPEQLVA